MTVLIRPEQAEMIAQLENEIDLARNKRVVAIEVALAGLVQGECVVKHIASDGTVTLEMVEV